MTELCDIGWKIHHVNLHLVRNIPILHLQVLYSPCHLLYLFHLGHLPVLKVHLACHLERVDAFGHEVPRHRCWYLVWRSLLHAGYLREVRCYCVSVSFLSQFLLVVGIRGVGVGVGVSVKWDGFGDGQFSYG